MTDTNVKPC